MLLDLRRMRSPERPPRPFVWNHEHAVPVVENAERAIRAYLGIPEWRDESKRLAPRVEFMRVRGDLTTASRLDQLNWDTRYSITVDGAVVWSVTATPDGGTLRFFGEQWTGRLSFLGRVDK